MMETDTRKKTQSPKKKEKAKAPDMTMRIGYSKRVNPLSDSARKRARKEWERLNMKRDHIKQFTTFKDEVHRIL